LDDDVRELAARLEEQELRLRAQEEELAALRDALSRAAAGGGRRPRRTAGEQAIHDARVPASPEPPAEGTTSPDPTRRGLLRSLAAGVAGAGAAGLLASARPAAAANGSPILVGQEVGSSPGTAAATVLNVVGGGFGPSSRSAFIVTDGQDPGTFGAAIQGLASSSLSDGVAGISLFGSAVVGYAPTTGYSLYAAGGGGLAIDPSAPTGPPVGDWVAGDLAATGDGALWANVGSAKPWRKLAGPTTAGSFHLLDPVRIFDTRAATWNRKLRSGERLVLGVSATQASASTAIPTDATAVTFNVTLDQTDGTGFVSVYPSDIPFPGTSTANWWAAGLTIANGGVSRLGNLPSGPNSPIPPTGGPSLAIQAGGGGATHVILDVTGYYR